MWGWGSPNRPLQVASPIDCAAQIPYFYAMYCFHLSDSSL